MLLAMAPALLVAGVDIQLKARAALAAPVDQGPRAAAQATAVVVVVVLDIGPAPFCKVARAAVRFIQAGTFILAAAAAAAVQIPPPLAVKAESAAVTAEAAAVVATAALALAELSVYNTQWLLGAACTGFLPNQKNSPM
jgi:hypothetical protein